MVKKVFDLRVHMYIYRAPIYHLQYFYDISVYLIEQEFRTQSSNGMSRQVYKIKGTITKVRYIIGMKCNIINTYTGRNSITNYKKYTRNTVTINLICVIQYS